MVVTRSIYLTCRECFTFFSATDFMLRSSTEGWWADMIKNLSLGKRFKNLLIGFDKLRRDTDGNIAVIFALATLPVVGAVGAAVDYSRVNSDRTAMQAAVDATALMLSKQIATLTTSQINEKASSYFAALYTRPQVTNISVTPTYTTTDTSQIVVAASGTVKASFVGLIGIPTIKIGASSTVKWGNSRLRVALVLDTTGSMNDAGKIDALKTATKNLLNQFKAAANNNGDVYVSIIPFNRDVNVGKSNYNANWIDWDEWEDDNGDDVSSTVCTKNGKKKKCTTSSTWVPDNHNTWNGCVTDRGNSNAPSSGNYDTNVVAPTTNNRATLFAAEQYDSCPAPVMPLSYDWLAMTNLVNSFSAAGNTNQGIGLVHGWMSLVGGGPYPAPPAEDPRYQYQKVIILMSDGLNTQNRWYDNANQIDARQQITCNNAKAAGITVYTIHVNTDGDPLSTLLQGCASSKDKFWMLTSASQMVQTFSTIGTQLSNLRVAK
jgi:Flp pilus assembly protein TadG